MTEQVHAITTTNNNKFLCIFLNNHIETIKRKKK